MTYKEAVLASLPEKTKLTEKQEARLKIIENFDKMQKQFKPLSAEKYQEVFNRR